MAFLVVAISLRDHDRPPGALKRSYEEEDPSLNRALLYATFVWCNGLGVV